MRSALIILLFALVSEIHAASFDCAKAKTSVEKLVCSDPSISALDDALNEEYETATAVNSDEENSSLRAQQKAWLASRNKCADIACLRRSYEKRIKELACSSNNTGSAVGALKCFGLKLSEAESVLTRLEQLQANGVLGASNNPERARELTREERKKWIEYRDAYCELFGETEGGSDGWKNAWAASCAVAETEKRIAALRNKLKTNR